MNPSVVQSTHKRKEQIQLSNIIASCTSLHDFSVHTQMYFEKSYAKIYNSEIKS